MATTGLGLPSGRKSLTQFCWSSRKVGCVVEHWHSHSSDEFGRSLWACLVSPEPLWQKDSDWQSERKEENNVSFVLWNRGSEKGGLRGSRAPSNHQSYKQFSINSQSRFSILVFDGVFVLRPPRLAQLTVSLFLYSSCTCFWRCLLQG